MNIIAKKNIKDNYSSFLSVFIIFLYGLANFLAAVKLANVGIVILTIIFIIPYMIKTIPRIPSKFYFFILVFIVLFIFQFSIFPANREGQIPTMVSFFTLGVVGLYVGSLKFNISKTLYFANRLAYINLFVNLFYITVARGNIDDVSMRFGYGLLPSTMFFLLKYMDTKDIRSLLLFILCVLLTFIWGSRGCLMVVMLFVAIKCLKKNPIKTIVLILTIFALSDLLINYLQYFIEILPIESYKLNKMQMMLEQGVVAASSGRDSLYEFYWSIFLDNLWGVGIGCQYLFGELYPHNLYIQTAVELGFVGLILMGIYTIYSLRIIFKQNKKIYEYLLVVYCITFGRLLVSSNFWDRPEFWYLLAIVFINPVIIHRDYKHKKKFHLSPIT